MDVFTRLYGQYPVLMAQIVQTVEHLLPLWGKV